MPILDHCICGVLDLRRGSLIIGVFTIIHSIMAIISTIYCLIKGPESFIYRKKYASAHTDEILYTVLWLLLLISFVYMAVCALLIHGVRKERKGFLVPWIIHSVLQVVFGMFAAIFLFVASTLHWELVLLAIFLIPFTICWSYAILVVISYFQALRAGFELPPPKINHPLFWNEYT